MTKCLLFRDSFVRIRRASRHCVQYGGQSGARGKDRQILIFVSRRGVTHAGIKFLRPVDLFEGRVERVLNERKEHLEIARSFRIAKNKQQRTVELQNVLH